MVANLTSCDSLSKILDSHSTGGKAFSLEEMASFFFIVLCGLFLATLGLVAEKLRAKSRHQKKEGTEIRQVRERQVIVM